MTQPRTASRYECSLKMGAGWQSSFHSAGNGKPRSRRCTYCGGAFRIETGLWGAFAWSSENRYPLGDALKTFASPTAAQKFADATSNGVVRWLPEGA